MAMGMASQAMESRALRAGFGVLLSAVLASAPAWAQAPADAAPDDRATQAEQLFAEGRALLDQGRYREACVKFELSSSLERSPGTLLNLGNCYESEGDLVRALSTFEQAFIDAQQSTDPERRQVLSDAARERIARLGKRVPQLTLRGLASASTASLDGQLTESADGPLRVNPGHHVLEVAAPGKLPRTQEFDIGIGQHIAINVAPLDPEVPLAPATTASPPPAAPSAAVPPEPASGLSSARASARASGYGPWPWILAGTSATLLGASLITGLTASSRSDQLDRECGARNCDPSLAHLQDSAQTFALATDVLWITGAIAAGVGVTLFVIEGNETEDTAVQGSCSGVGCGLRASGRF